MNTAVRWIAGAAVAALGVAYALAPHRDGDATGRPRFRSNSPADSLYVEWDSERAKLDVLRRVLERGESRALAREGVRAGVRSDLPLLQVDAALGPGVRAALQQQLDAELTGANSLPTRYPIAVVARVDTLLRGSWYTRAIVLPLQPGEPCVAVLRFPPVQRTRFALAATQRLLGTCAFYAAYGTPGAPTARWLVETRGVAARYLAPPSAFLDDTLRMRLGVSTFGWNPLAESLLRCRMHDADACERFIGPDPTGPGYFDFMYEVTIDRSLLGTEFPGVDVDWSTRWSGDGPRLRSGMLASLAAAMGPERFGALWRDPRGLEEAYLASTGRPLTSFVEDRVAARTLPYLAGPAIPALSTALALAILAVLTGFAILRSPRRMT